MDRQLFRSRARIWTQDCLGPPCQAAFQPHPGFLARHPSGMGRPCKKGLAGTRPCSQETGAEGSRCP